MQDHDLKKKEEAVVEYVLEFCETNALDYQREKLLKHYHKSSCNSDLEDKKTVVLFKDISIWYVKKQ
ncbi:MAG: hypothetical protein IPG53_17475 [Ignavibacteriales bacterium]|nr:hypothetical protein [Ignavibacteriales bacterium]